MNLAAQKKLKHAINFHGVSLMNKMYLPTVGPQDWQKLLAILKSSGDRLFSTYHCVSLGSGHEQEKPEYDY